MITTARPAGRDGSPGATASRYEIGRSSSGRSTVNDHRPEL